MNTATKIRHASQRVYRGWVDPALNVLLPVAAFALDEARRAWPSVLAAVTLGVAGAGVLVLVGG